MRDKLTPKEVEIMKLVAEGLANKEIAFKLGKTPAVIKIRLQLIYSKLGARNRVDAVVKVLQVGYFLLNDLGEEVDVLNIARLLRAIHGPVVAEPEFKGGLLRRLLKRVIRRLNDG